MLTSSCVRHSVGAHLASKQIVAGSSPVSRSRGRPACELGRIFLTLGEPRAAHECLPKKQIVAGSSPVSRSKTSFRLQRTGVFRYPLPRLCSSRQFNFRPKRRFRDSLIICCLASNSPGQDRRGQLGRRNRIRGDDMDKSKVDIALASLRSSRPKP